MQNLIVVTNVLGDLGTNCYTIVNTATREAAIVDPAGNADYLVRMCTEQKYKPVAILLTHGHFDHTAGVNDLKKTYPDIPVIIGEKDEEMLGNCTTNLSAMFLGTPLFVKADQTVKDGEKLPLLGTEITCIEVPGHTVGGMCYYFAENNMIFDGDTLFCGSVGRSDFPTGDSVVLADGIQQKLFTLPEDTIVYPGHNNRTKIGVEKKYNPFF